MKYPLILLCFLCVGFSTHAQEKVELFNSLEQIGALKRLNKTFDLKKGENLILTVTLMRGKLGKLVVDVPGAQLKLLDKKITKIDREIIRVSKTGTYAFHFINQSIFKKELDIKRYIRNWLKKDLRLENHQLVLIQLLKKESKETSS